MVRVVGSVSLPILVPSSSPVGTRIRLSLTPPFACFCDLGKLLHFRESELIPYLGVRASAAAHSSLLEIESWLGYRDLSKGSAHVHKRSVVDR